MDSSRLFQCGCDQLLAPLYRLSAKEKNLTDVMDIIMVTITMIMNISTEAVLKSMEEGTDAIKERGKIVMNIRRIAELYMPSGLMAI
jgi:hypothetical protein